MASNFGKSMYFGEMPDVFRRTPSPPPKQPLSPIAQSEISTASLDVEKGHQQHTSDRDPQATTHDIHDNQRQTDAELLMNVARTQDRHSKHIEGGQDDEYQPTHRCEQESAVKGMADKNHACTTSPPMSTTIENVSDSDILFSRDPTKDLGVEQHGVDDRDCTEGKISTDVEIANPNKTESAFNNDGESNTQSRDVDDTINEPNELNDHIKTNIIQQGGELRSSPLTNHRDTLIELESGSATTNEPITESQVSLDSSTTIEHKSLGQPRKQATKCPACSIIPRKTLDGEDELWVECHGCKKWYHLACIGLTEEKVAAIDKFSCPKCWYSCGPTSYVRKSGRAHAFIDYAGLNEGVVKSAKSELHHPYIKLFLEDDIPVIEERFPRMQPHLVTGEFMQTQSGFKEPVLIPARLNPRGSLLENGLDRLGMRVPENLTVRQVANLYGPGEKVPVIDVKSQGEAGSWTLAKFADYYETPGKKAVKNVISLEVSDTPLARMIERPQVVRDLDLVDQVWPEALSAKGIYPRTRLYCLMSVANSYTDFHIDFGGSSVFYHLISGRKTFLFIAPSKKNLKTYERWCNSPDQGTTFLPSLTGGCHRVDLSAGDTMLIPSGWIHAVWTPEDAVVIGGNFMTRLHLETQLQVNEIEKMTKTPRKFRMPSFQEVHWYAAVEYLERDLIPRAVLKILHDGGMFERTTPVWEEEASSHEMAREGDESPAPRRARLYSKYEMEGLPSLIGYLRTTALLAAGKPVPSKSFATETRKAVQKAMPSTLPAEPLILAQLLAAWYAWKIGNVSIPEWAHPDFYDSYEVEPIATVSPPKKASRVSKRKQAEAEKLNGSKLTPERMMPTERNNGSKRKRALDDEVEELIAAEGRSPPARKRFRALKAPVRGEERSPGNDSPTKVSPPTNDPGALSPPVQTRRNRPFFVEELPDHDSDDEALQRVFAAHSGSGERAVAPQAGERGPSEGLARKHEQGFQMGSVFNQQEGVPDVSDDQRVRYARDSAHHEEASGARPIRQGVDSGQTFDQEGQAIEGETSSQSSASPRSRITARGCSQCRRKKTTCTHRSDKSASRIKSGPKQGRIQKSKRNDRRPHNEHQLYKKRLLEEQISNTNDHLRPAQQSQTTQTTPAPTQCDQWTQIWAPLEDTQSPSPPPARRDSQSCTDPGEDWSAASPIYQPNSPPDPFMNLDRLRRDGNSIASPGGLFLTPPPPRQQLSPTPPVKRERSASPPRGPIDMSDAEILALIRNGGMAQRMAEIDSVWREIDGEGTPQPPSSVVPTGGEKRQVEYEGEEHYDADDTLVASEPYFQVKRGSEANNTGLDEYSETIDEHPFEEGTSPEDTNEPITPVASGTSNATRRMSTPEKILKEAIPSFGKEPRQRMTTGGGETRPKLSGGVIKKTRNSKK